MARKNPVVTGIRTRKPSYSRLLVTCFIHAASSNIWSRVKKTPSLFQDETNEMRLKGESCLNAHLIVTLVELDRPGPVGMI